MAPGAFAVILIAIAGRASGHGHMTYPHSSRHGGSLQTGGDCGLSGGACYWFTNNQQIPGEPTLDDASIIRSVNVDVSSGAQDWSRKNPWRAPGSAPVLGSGCGVAGGGPIAFANGGIPPPGVAQGTDGITLAAKTPTKWAPGSVQEVGLAVSANHAGGYSWRLCKIDGAVNESCFQQGALSFAGNTSFLVYADGTWSEIPRVVTSIGTTPSRSQWARFPVPSCLLCNPVKTCGEVLPATPGLNYESAWNEQVNCNAACAGSIASKAGGSCPGQVQFPEPMAKLSGFGKSIWGWSVIDQVVVPSGMEPGAYLLSLRWDAEQSDQVFQNCADITISADGSSDPGLTFEIGKQMMVYHPKGSSVCKNNLYENCDKGTDSKSDGKLKQYGEVCLKLGEDKGMQACDADSRCERFEKSGKTYCWEATAATKTSSSDTQTSGAFGYLSHVWAAVTIAAASA